jgi:hypothetical protein
VDKHWLAPNPHFGFTFRRPKGGLGNFHTLMSFIVIKEQRFWVGQLSLSVQLF